nr:collagen alpha-1(I) chain-like [Meriones unguiculatus]
MEVQLHEEKIVLCDHNVQHPYSATPGEQRYTGERSDTVPKQRRNFLSRTVPPHAHEIRSLQEPQSSPHREQTLRTSPRPRNRRPVPGDPERVRPRAAPPPINSLLRSLHSFNSAEVQSPPSGEPGRRGPRGHCGSGARGATRRQPGGSRRRAAGGAAERDAQPSGAAGRTGPGRQCAFVYVARAAAANTHLKSARVSERQRPVVQSPSRRAPRTPGPRSLWYISDLTSRLGLILRWEPFRGVHLGVRGELAGMLRVTCPPTPPTLPTPRALSPRSWGGCNKSSNGKERGRGPDNAAESRATGAPAAERSSPSPLQGFLKCKGCGAGNHEESVKGGRSGAQGRGGLRGVWAKTKRVCPGSPWTVEACPSPPPPPHQPPEVLQVASRSALRDHPAAERVDLSSRGIAAPPGSWPSSQRSRPGGLPWAPAEAGKGLGPRVGNFGESRLLLGRRSSSPPPLLSRLGSLPGCGGRGSGGGEGGRAPSEPKAPSGRSERRRSGARNSPGRGAGGWFPACASAFAGSVPSQPAAAKALPPGALRLPRQAAGSAVQQPRGNLRDCLKFPPQMLRLLLQLPPPRLGGALRVIRFLPEYIRLISLEVKGYRNHMATCCIPSATCPSVLKLPLATSVPYRNPAALTTADEIKAQQVLSQPARLPRAWGCRAAGRAGLKAGLRGPQSLKVLPCQGDSGACGDQGVGQRVGVLGVPKEERRGRSGWGGASDRAPVSHRPPGRSLLGLVTLKFLSSSGPPQQPRHPARVQNTSGTGVREGLPPALPESPARSSIRYLPGAPGPRSPRPRARSGRTAAFSSSRGPGARRGVPGPGPVPTTTTTTAGARSQGLGAGERPSAAAAAAAGEARAPAHCRWPRAPRALGPAAKRVSGPVSPAGLRDARSRRYK